ncbi:expressed unknown protein [Seminavis robusta]|uniref:Uncharacterized protein n=1 Tax=Seminavis robusta TaxID=568900 RepID=A0A9N8E021_9STRA|nr:expressed unknown protein [Seminavis robusta]|eukprot:Sro403_g135640.1 n/a (230) ;mRNA; r:26947-27636
MFAALEKPVAYGAFLYASTTLMWKAVGVDWIPVLGASMKAIFTSPDNEEQLPQYPRRNDKDDESLWHVIYLLMYGVLGTLAQYGGLKISSRKIASRQTLVFWCRVYALFHIVIGTHHLLWSLKLQRYGKLELWRYQLPAVYELTGVAALGLIYQAVAIGRVTSRNADIKDICHRKAVMDTVTCCTFLSFVAFLIANMAGIQTSFETERIWWALTMYPVPVVLLLGFVWD